MHGGAKRSRAGATAQTATARIASAARKLKFRMEIHTKSDQFVRYLLHKVNAPIEMIEIKELFFQETVWSADSSGRPKQRVSEVCSFNQKISNLLFENSNGRK